MNIALRKRISSLRSAMCRGERKIKIVLYIMCNFLSSKFSVDNDLLNAIDSFTIFLNKINKMIDELIYLAISLLTYMYHQTIEIYFLHSLSVDKLKNILEYISKRNRFRIFGTEPNRTEKISNRTEPTDFFKISNRTDFGSVRFGLKPNRSHHWKLNRKRKIYLTLRW